MNDYRDDQWSNGERTLDGCVALVRRNESLAEVNRGNYPYELMVSLIYEENPADGLPCSVDEMQLLDQNEEAIADRLCGRYGARLALCVTSGGARDLFLYLAHRPTDQELADDLAACSPTVDYDFGIRESPDWSVYVNAVSEADDEPPPPRSAAPAWKKWFGLN